MEMFARPVDNTFLSLTATMPHIALYYLCVLVVSMATPTSTAECPRMCECKWKNGKESVACLNANLTAVPTDLDSGTQVLDLTENSIGTLRDQVFSRVGLVNLQKIFLVKCRLKSIEKYAFKNLINLVELDLSYNALSEVPSASFTSISELRELRLNSNPIHLIANEAFINTPQLTKLELSNCKITHIEPASFTGLENTLVSLKIDNNNLSEVEASSFTILHSLHGLELAGNPWNCSCKLRELRQWMRHQNVPYTVPPICQNPKRLLNKSWKALEPDDFACPPNVHPNQFKTEGIDGDNVTISCQITGIPRPNVTWLLRNKLIANLTSAAKKVYIVNEKTNVSELTIYSADQQDAGVYTCAAENKAGKSEAMLTLTVSKKSSNTIFSNKALLVSVLLGVAFAVLCCLLAVCLVNVRKRRLLKWHVAECRRDDANYEKIEMKQSAAHRNLNGDVNREDSGPVTITKKNGDYSVVPGTDTDRENDEEEEEEESTLEITTPGTSNEKKWTSEEVGPRKNDVGRGTEQIVRDTISRTYSSMYGTYRTSPTDVKALRTSAAPPHRGQADVKTIYTTLTSLHQVPDVIGHSSIDKTRNGSRTQSEHGSANDINELFCTLPRKRDLMRYRSSDSQSPLLPESRYGSDSSSENFTIRRLSVETQQKYPGSRNRNHSQPSGSMLNLNREDKTVNLSPTPLLDVKGLETRLSPHQPQYQTDLRMETCNPYDYHAAQLEKFLEEYRTLQKELTRMKETCDSICQGQMRGTLLSPSTAPNPSSGLQANEKPNSNSNSNSIRDSVDFKNFENELAKYLLSTNNITSGALHN